MDPKHELHMSVNDCKSQLCREDSKLFFVLYLLMRKYKEV